MARAQNGGRVGYETAHGKTCMSDAAMMGRLDVMALLQVRPRVRPAYL
jgi:hypothetical protein